MSIIDRLFGRRVVLMRVGSSTSVLGKSPADLYDEQPELRAVVSYVSDAIASTPLKCYVRAGETDRRRDRTSSAALLLDSPADGVTTFELVSALVGDLCLYGAALWYVSPNEMRESGWEITRLPYAWVQSVLTDDGFVPSAYVIQNPDAGTAQVRIDASSVVRFAAYNPASGVVPVSPVESLKRILEERMHALDYRNAVWRNGGWVSRWISRPQGASWDPEQRERWANSWKAHFAGSDGTDTGGTPILEDGMQLHDTTINAKEAQFAESAQLTREEVCAAYHINPSLIYHTSTQTYASAKDNARALYSEALMPVMDLVCERINKVLLPMVGADPREYVEFDLTSKISASFEEQASVLTSSVGGPWMTADEARARLNMPALGGNAAELIQPLNLAYGDGGASNTLMAGAPGTKSREEPVKRKTRRTPSAEGSARLTTALSKFFERQSKRVLPEIEKAKAKGGTKAAAWWDERRWNRELADDLEPIFLDLTKKGGREALRDVDLDPDDYDQARTEAYIRKMAEGKATAINAVTYQQLRRALNLDEDEVNDDVLGDTPQGVFDKAKDSRAESSGVSFATACSVWGGMEAIRQCAPAKQYVRRKTWIHVGGGQTDRSEHVAMDGETVGFDEPFSNGAQWPHDQILDPEETCYCRCQVEVSIWEV